ncbi:MULTISPECIES: hypothetical protein [unclassified Lysobacter]|uniref:hypothetical protein n=1 Tax=unclassified Lysobacter TaxID=2635362 RepID=UPI001BE57977|nr:MULTISPECIES: hypothetical protein [unclassified Lysobacter]MBT2744803.1 hypothetical protein [Lysobacter sp. ISL-42]MBT2752204.1 hypothetical protein [Lysobacter sp. ISL-50]MBT2778701.1 hypothetical protein [Lysobacter sp. ISL-54]MBT2780368.1 hypothetical protein [Lysobacter sp. ISL-52]
MLLLSVLLPGAAFGGDIKLQVDKQFDQCMRETRKDSEQCSFGGCGNIVGACYERQLGTIAAATEPLAKRLSTGRCAQAAASVATDIDTLDSRLKSLPPLDNTWNGYEVQVEVALLKRKVMSAIAKECGSDP